MFVKLCNNLFLKLLHNSSLFCSSIKLDLTRTARSGCIPHTLFEYFPLASNFAWMVELVVVDQAQNLTLRHVEINAVDGVDISPAGQPASWQAKVLLEIIYPHQGFCGSMITVRSSRCHVKVIYSATCQSNRRF